jgi:hypothetical protein
VEGAGAEAAWGGPWLKAEGAEAAWAVGCRVWGGRGRILGLAATPA